MLGCNTHFDLPSCCSDRNSVAMHVAINKYFIFFFFIHQYQSCCQCSWNSQGSSHPSSTNNCKQQNNFGTSFLGQPWSRPFWPDIGGALQVQSRNQIQWNGEAGVVFVLVLVSPQRIHTSPHVTYCVSPVQSSAVRYT